MGKTIHIHLHSTPTRDAGNWEESKHPRAENGQFGKGSGGGAAAKKSAPAKKPAGGSADPGKTPGTHQYHQAKADAMRGEYRPYGNEAGNLHISTLTHHQNAAHALKALATAQGTEHRKGLKEQADFHMGKAAEGEKRLAELGHGKRPKKTTGFGFGGDPKPASKPGEAAHHQERAAFHAKALTDTSKTDAQLKEHADAKWHHERVGEQLDLLKRMGPDSVAKESVQKTIKHHMDFAAKHEANLQQGGGKVAPVQTPASPREVYAEHRKEAGARGQEALDLAEKARNSTDPKVVEAAMNAIEKAHRAHSLAGQAARKIPYPGNSSPWEHHDERTAALSKLAESMHQRHFALTKGKGK